MEQEPMQTNSTQPNYNIESTDLNPNTMVSSGIDSGRIADIGIAQTMAQTEDTLRNTPMDEQSKSAEIHNAAAFEFAKRVDAMYPDADEELKKQLAENIQTKFHELVEAKNQKIESNRLQNEQIKQLIDALANGSKNVKLVPELPRSSGIDMDSNGWSFTIDGVPFELE